MNEHPNLRGARKASQPRCTPFLALVLLVVAPAIVEASVTRTGALDRAGLAVAPSALRIAPRTSPAASDFSLFTGDELARAIDRSELDDASFALGLAAEDLDVDHVIVSRARELRLNLYQELELVDAEPLRGPPDSEPKTRIGGLELSEPFRHGEEPRLTLGLQWACGDSSCELAEDQRKDPLGLAAKKYKGTSVSGKAGRWNVPSGSFAPAPIGTEAPGYIRGGSVETATQTSVGRSRMTDRRELREIGVDEVTLHKIETTRQPISEVDVDKVGQLATRIAPLEEPAMIGLFLLSPFMAPPIFEFTAGPIVSIGNGSEMAEAAAAAAAARTGTTTQAVVKALRPADFGLKTIAEDPVLHRLWQEAMKGAESSSRSNKYQKLLNLYESGGNPSQELLEEAFTTVNNRFLDSARAQGYSIREVHHWNFKKGTYSGQVFDPRNLVPAPSRQAHQAMHSATSNPGNMWSSGVSPQHELPIDSSAYPLAPK